MARIDPLRNFRYRLEIDNIAQAGFSEVMIAETTIDAVDYREGTDPPHVRKLSGLTKYGNITLKWGITDDTELWDWRQRIVDGKVDRKNVSIVVFDSEGNEKVRWLFQRAWPSKLDAADMNAKGNEVAVMQMTLSHEGMSQ